MIDQFLRDGSNKRDDSYGGSIENRARFALEVVDAILKVWPSARVGIRLAPVSPANDIANSNPAALFGYLVARLSERRLAYIHIIKGATQGDRNIAAFDYSALRSAFSGAYIANNGYTREMAIETLAEGPPTSSPSAGRSSPIPISSNACASGLPWRRSTARRSMAAARGLHGLSRARGRLSAAAVRPAGTAPALSVASASSSTDMALPRQTKRLLVQPWSHSQGSSEIARDPGGRATTTERPAGGARQRRFGAVPDGAASDGERRGRGRIPAPRSPPRPG